MNIDKISENQMNDLKDAVAKVLEDISTGVDPSVSVAKVATLKQYTPPFVDRLVEAVNVSLALSRFKSASTGTEKAASFPIADSKKVIKIMYDDTDKVASTIIATKSAQVYDDDDFFVETQVFITEQPISLDNLSEHKTIDMQPIDHIYKKASAAVDELKNRAESYRIEYVQNVEKSKQLMDKLAYYFMTYHKEPFEHVEAAALKSYGNAIKPFMDVIYTRANSNEKRASVAKFNKVRDLTPYKYVTELYDSLEKAAIARKRYNEVNKEYEQFRDEFKERQIKLAFLPIELNIKNLLLPEPFDGDKEVQVNRTVAKPELANKEDDIDLLRSQLQSIVTLYGSIAKDPVFKNIDKKELYGALNKALSIAPNLTTEPEFLKSIVFKILHSEVLDPMDIKTLIESEWRKMQVDDMRKPEIAKGKPVSLVSERIDTLAKELDKIVGKMYGERHGGGRRSRSGELKTVIDRTIDPSRTLDHSI